MAKCPHCGKRLRWYHFRAECKFCGVNIPNYDWENRLEQDADTAEKSFAKLHYKLKNFRYGTVGSPLMIARLVFSLLPLVALVVPLMKVSFNLPFYTQSETVSFLTFILNYLTKFDIGKVLSLMSGELTGPIFTKLALGVGASLLAVVFGVINFFAVFVTAIKFSSTLDIILNTLSTACWSLSALFLWQFTQAAAASSLTFFSGTISLFFAVGTVIFLANVVINIFVAKAFKKKKAQQPTLEEAISIELQELREKDSRPIAE